MDFNVDLEGTVYARRECEHLGHKWKAEASDGESGTETLICERCGDVYTARWT